MLCSMSSNYPTIGHEPPIHQRSRQNFWRLNAPKHKPAGAKTIPKGQEKKGQEKKRAKINKNVRFFFVLKVESLLFSFLFSCRHIKKAKRLKSQPGSMETLLWSRPPKLLKGLKTEPEIEISMKLVTRYGGRIVLDLCYLRKENTFQREVVVLKKHTHRERDEET